MHLCVAHEATKEKAGYRERARSFMYSESRRGQLGRGREPTRGGSGSREG